MSNEIAQATVFEASPGLADQIADHVQKQIVSGELQPGDRIAEASITRELGVSRGPVRESMRVLARRHMVDLLPRKGASVSEFGAEDVISLYDLQKALMLLLVQKVSKCWQPSDLDRFAKLQNELATAAEQSDALGMIAGSFQFQRAACEVAKNSYLTAAIVDLQPSFSRAYYRALAVGTEEMKSLAEFIQALITYIVDDKVTECERLIDRFTKRQCRLVLDTFSDL